MASTQVSICNVACARIGERQLLTNPAGTIDTSVDNKPVAFLCAALYPNTRDALLTRFPWDFATAQQPLDRTGTIDYTDTDGWKYRYSLPLLFLAAQYIYAGSRPGQGSLVSPSGSVPPVVGPPVLGQVPMLPFEVRGGYILTDTFIPPLWASGTTYATGDLVFYAGVHYSSLVDSNTSHTPASGSAYWAATGIQPTFVYTLQAGEATFTPLFADALAWALAADLALSQATKPAVAKAMADAAETAFRRATAAELTGRQFDPKPASRFITSRS